MTARLDILVVGGANYDYLIKARALPAPGETVAGDALYEAPGGKGANQAIAAARLGARTAFIGRVGDDDRGRAVVAALARDGVATEHCVIDRSAPTGVALIAVDERGEKLIVTMPGANARLVPADLERAGAVFAAAKVVLLQLETGLATTLAAARRARAAGALVVLDAAPPVPDPAELLATIDVVRANASEARVLTGRRVDSVDDAREAALALRRPGGGAACVATEGGDLLVFGDGGEAWLPRQRVETIDATGAGDAFAAALAVGLAEDRSLTEAAWLGCAAAALATTRLGAQAGLPARDEVERFLATIARDA
jgi:ribokinase